jgi:hypothetical protein
MVRKTLLGVALFSITSSLLAMDLVPLEKFIRDYPPKGQDQSLLYISYRCTAVLTAVSGISESGPLKDTVDSKLQRFLAKTIALQSQLSGVAEKEAERLVFKTLEDILRRYAESMNGNYVTKGHYIEGNALVDDDLKVCAAVLAP